MCGPSDGWDLLTPDQQKDVEQADLEPITVVIGYCSTDTCTRCGLKVSGVGSTEELAESRFRNNMGLHLGGRRCARRSAARKAATQ